MHVIEWETYRTKRLFSQLFFKTTNIIIYWAGVHYRKKINLAKTLTGRNPKYRVNYSDVYTYEVRHLIIHIVEI